MLEVAPVADALAAYINKFLADKFRFDIHELHLAVEEGSKEETFGTGYGMELFLDFGGGNIAFTHLYQSVAFGNEVTHVFAGNAVLPPLEVLHQCRRTFVLVTAFPCPFLVFLVREHQEVGRLVEPAHLFFHPVVHLPKVHHQSFDMATATYHQILLLYGFGWVGRFKHFEAGQGKEQLYLDLLRSEGRTLRGGFHQHRSDRFQFGNGHVAPAFRHP